MDVADQKRAWRLRVADSGVPASSDEELAGAARQDRDAYRQLYHRYVNDVYSYFTWKLGRNAAEDLTAETFLRALQSLDRFDTGRTWRSWLFGIASRVFREHARRESRERNARDSRPETTEVLHDLDDALFSAERAALGRRLLACLGDGDREAIELRYWAALSYREIGLVMGTSEGATRVRVHRVLQKLRRILENTK